MPQEVSPSRRRGLVRLCAALLALPLAECQREPAKPTVAGAPTPQQIATQNREDEFRRKEQCANAAGIFDRHFDPPGGARSLASETSVSEVFYSSQRNSCVCELSTVGNSGNAKYGRSSLITLYDCLTREEIATTLIASGAPDAERRVAQWKDTKAALK